MAEAASAPVPSPASMPRLASSRIACRIGDLGAAQYNEEVLCQMESEIPIEEERVRT